MRIFTTLVASALVSFGFSVHAATANNQGKSDLIDGSYFVQFKPATGSRPSLIVPPSPKDPKLGRKNPPPFGEHSTGQSKKALAATLALTGTVVSILESINGAHIMMDAKEADRLRLHPDVLLVEQSKVVVGQTTQSFPGWALDRMDQPGPGLDYSYQYSSNGAGQTIYILDSGLDLSNPKVASEFWVGNTGVPRAQIVYDRNPGGLGYDCNGHGTFVASLAGGTTYGVAKGVALYIAKMTKDEMVNGVFTCTGRGSSSEMATAINWVALNAPRGTIINYSQGPEIVNCSTPSFAMDLENAVIAAYNAGIIFVSAAGNGVGNIGCNTNAYTPARLPQAFVVGATEDTFDLIAPWTNSGTNVSTFAPGTNVAAMWFEGSKYFGTGTSFSAPLISGIFAIACQYLIQSGTSPTCQTAADAGVVYSALRNTGLPGTVHNPDWTTTLPFGATSRFIWKQNW